MKNYLALLFLLSTCFCFGQIEPISEIDAVKLNKSTLSIHPLFEKNNEGNSIVVQSSKGMYVSILDDNLKEVRGKKITLPNLFQGYDEYFQDEENIYRIYGDLGSGYLSKKRPSPTGMTIGKEGFEFRTKVLLDLSKGERFLCHKIVDDITYLFTFHKNDSKITIYKFKEFKIVDVFMFEDEIFTLKKDFFLKLFSGNISYENDVFYIANKTATVSDFVSEFFIFDLKSKAFSQREFSVNLDLLDLSISQYPFEVSTKIKLFTQEIVDDKLLFLFRVKNGFYLNIFDFESTDLLESRKMVIRSEASDFQLFHSREAFGLAETLLKYKVSDSKSFNKKNMRFGLGGGSSSVLESLNSKDKKHLLLFGKEKAVYEKELGSVHPSFSGFTSDFSLVEFDVENLSFSNMTSEFWNKIDDYKHIYLTKNAKYTKPEYQRTEEFIFYNSVMRLITYDRKEAKIFIY